MAETVLLTTKSSVAFTQTSDIDVGERTYQGATSHNQTFDNGTAANQINQLYTDTITVAASANSDLDLSGALTNAFGTSITFTKIKYLEIRAASANTNNLIVGAAGTNPIVSMFGDASDTITIRPGGNLILKAPDNTAYAVAAGSADVLRIANSSSGTSVTFTIIIGGVM